MSDWYSLDTDGPYSDTPPVTSSLDHKYLANITNALTKASERRNAETASRNVSRLTDTAKPTSRGTIAHQGDSAVALLSGIDMTTNKDTGTRNADPTDDHNSSCLAQLYTSKMNDASKNGLTRANVTMHANLDNDSTVSESFVLVDRASNTSDLMTALEYMGSELDTPSKTQEEFSLDEPKSIRVDLGAETGTAATVQDRAADSVTSIVRVDGLELHSMRAEFSAITLAHMRAEDMLLALKLDLFKLERRLIKIGVLSSSEDERSESVNAKDEKDDSGFGSMLAEDGSIQAGAGVSFFEDDPKKMLAELNSKPFIESASMNDSSVILPLSCITMSMLESNVNEMGRQIAALTAKTRATVSCMALPDITIDGLNEQKSSSRLSGHAESLPASLAEDVLTNNKSRSSTACESTEHATTFKEQDAIFRHGPYSHEQTKQMLDAFREAEEMEERRWRAVQGVEDASSNLEKPVSRIGKVMKVARRILVSNIATDAQEEDIRRVFLNFIADIEKIKILPFRHEHNGTKMAYVSMRSRRAAVRASRVSGSIFGLMVNIKLVMD